MSRFRMRDLPAGRLLLAAVLLVANAVALAGWTAPRWAVVAPSGPGRGLEAARQSLEPALERARATYGKVLEAEADLAALEERLVVEGGASTLMAAVHAAAGEARVGVRESTWQLRFIEELRLVQLGMTIPVEGSYAALRRFLDVVAGAEEFLVVQSVSLSPASASAPGGNPQTDLVLAAFLEDPSLAADGATAAGGPGTVAAGAAAGAAARAAGGASASAIADLSAAPTEAAESLRSRLQSLPPLPVEPAALEVDLQRLEAARRPSAAPTRNLFAVVTLPAAEPVVEAVEEPEVTTAEPELPLRLLGVLRVDGRHFASLTDGVELYVAPAGTQLPNGFEIVEVGVDYAEVVSGERRARLTLEESST